MSKKLTITVTGDDSGEMATVLYALLHIFKFKHTTLSIDAQVPDIESIDHLNQMTKDMSSKKIIINTAK